MVVLGGNYISLASHAHLPSLDIHQMKGVKQSWYRSLEVWK